jgi:hypothetical protein
MTNIAILRLSLGLCFEVIKAIKQAKQDDELEKINENPNDWFVGHFGGMRDSDKAKADKTDI